MIENNFHGGIEKKLEKEGEKEPEGQVENDVSELFTLRDTIDELYIFSRQLIKKEFPAVAGVIASLVALPLIYHYTDYNCLLASMALSAGIGQPIYITLKYILDL